MMISAFRSRKQALWFSREHAGRGSTQAASGEEARPPLKGIQRLFEEVVVTS
jgi:hypothetical protein